MTNLHFLDHAFVLAMFIVFPAYSALTIRRTLEDIRQRGETARILAYQWIILTTMLFAACIVAMWLVSDRSWTSLGFALPTPTRFLIGSLIGTAFIALIVLPLRKLSKSSEGFDQLTHQVGDLLLLMPRSKREESWFTAVSTNAGIAEELIYRGYLLWYLQHFIGLWAAAVASVVLFACAHLYQGTKQLPGIAMTSAVTVTLFVLTESLLLPVIFHIIFDALQGRYIAKIHRAAAGR